MSTSELTTVFPGFAPLVVMANATVESGVNNPNAANTIKPALHFFVTEGTFIRLSTGISISLAHCPRKGREVVPPD